MEDYKSQFIERLHQGPLWVGEEPGVNRDLKSKRKSPWFLNVGDAKNAGLLRALGDAYAGALIQHYDKFDVVVGIPEKGREICSAAMYSIADKRPDTLWFSVRKEAKTIGEASNLSDVDKIKGMVVGEPPKPGMKIVELDDVFTDGTAKYEFREVLNSLGKLVGGEFEYPLLLIALDRMEVGIGAEGVSAIDSYEQKTGTKVFSTINALDVVDFRRANNLPVDRMVNYLRVYGTELARARIVGRFGKLEQRIIENDRSVIPACDVPLEQFEEIVKATGNLPGIGGYKIPIISGKKGWETWVGTARKYTTKPLIMDGQKFGTDIPDTGQEVMRNLKEAGFDAVILFPQSGPETERAWIYHAFDFELKVIVGGRMTHPGYAVSEGGWITDEGALNMYRLAARAGVNNFVVPGNKPEIIKQVRAAIESEGVLNPIFYAPGFIAQGGKIADTAKVAGERFHGIVGRGIYEAKDIRAAAIEHTSQLI